MRKTNPGDEQTKSRQVGVRRKQGADQYQPDSDCATALRRTRNRDGDQPQRVDRAVCAGNDSIGGSLTGGILRQLIGKMDSQLAKLDDRLIKLEQERQETEQQRQEAEQEKAQLQALLSALQQTEPD